MQSYNTRAFHFFLQSLHALKKESGGQRWNAICEDAANLFETNYPKELSPLFLSHIEIWELLFEPPLDCREPLYMKFEMLCSKDIFLDFFFKILQSLLDPPAAWWQKMSSTV
jgi:hypothetical protein